MKSQEPVWNEKFDDNYNSIWEAKSPCEEGFMWRLKQRLHSNEIEWYEDHDPELFRFEEAGADRWHTLNEAKAAISKSHANIIQENSNAND